MLLVDTAMTLVMIFGVFYVLLFLPSPLLLYLIYELLEWFAQSSMHLGVIFIILWL